MIDVSLMANGGNGVTPRNAGAERSLRRGFNPCWGRRKKFLARKIDPGGEDRDYNMQEERCKDITG